MPANRKEFLRLMAAIAVLRPATQAAPQQPHSSGPVVDQGPFPLRVLEDCGAAMRCALSYIGDRVGLFQSMADAGPLTATDLAQKTKLNERLVREWLNSMATARYIEYRPTDKTYLLRKEHADVLANEDFSAMSGMIQLVNAVVSAAPKVAQAFQTGKPVAWSEYGPDVNTGGHRATLPDFKHELAQKWIPLMPHVQEILTTGGTSVDVGCGTGLASIMLAKAFPKSQFSGYDPFLPAIRRAREFAKKERVADRVHFVAADAARLPAGQFNLLTIFNSVHHFSNPVMVLRQCRQALKPGGTCFILDLDLSLNPEDNINLNGRLAYPMSTLLCLHDSMGNQGVGTGMEFNESILRDFSAKAGFSRCRKLAGSTPVKAFYELRA